MTEGSTQVDKDVPARCQAIGSSSTWSDALDSFGISGVVEGIKRRSGGQGIVGLALTARQLVLTQLPNNLADLAVDTLVGATGPGRVLMIDVGGAKISTFGGLAALAAKAQGATAVLIDSACRAVDEIQAVGLWMASRWISPWTGKIQLQLQQMGAQVTTGSVVVREGDLVIAYDTGIVVLPRVDLNKSWSKPSAFSKSTLLWRKGSRRTMA